MVLVKWGHRILNLISLGALRESYQRAIEHGAAGYILYFTNTPGNSYCLVKIEMTHTVRAAFFATFFARTKIIFLGGDKKRLRGHQLILRAAVLAETTFYEGMNINLLNKIKENIPTQHRPQRSGEIVEVRRIELKISLISSKI